MGPDQWMAEFRKLHTAFVQGKLSDTDKSTYFVAREQLARALCASQGLTLKAGEVARETFRIRHAFQVDLAMALANARVATQDVSRGGFSCILAKAPDPNEEVKFTLKLPGGATPLEGVVKLASAVRQVGNFRVSFTFQHLATAELDRLETALFDAALSRMP